MCTLKLSLAGILLLASLGARSFAGPQALPDQVLVGVDPSIDSAAFGTDLAGFVGTVIGYSPQLHVHQIKLRPEVSVQSAIVTLSHRPGVLYAEPNGLYQAASTPNDTSYKLQWAPPLIQANYAWGIWKPKTEVIIAVLDTGIDYTHPDLTNKILRDSSGHVIGYNAVGSNAHSGNGKDPIDDNGHGTHCAGIAAAQSDNGLGVAGIAGWDGTAGASDTTYTKIMPVKVLDETAWGTDADIAAGMTWAVDHGARVLSMSICGDPSFTLDNAVSYAWNKGCLIIAAAGNNASTSPMYPAAYSKVISVAATDKTDTLASFSNYGSWVLTAAPGTAIYSTTPTYSTKWPLNYCYGAGTSMATPHVSGEAALILAQNTSLTNTQVKALILGHTDPYFPYSGRTISPGGGRINVYSALWAAGNGNLPPPPVNLIATPGNGKVSLSWSPATGAISYNIKRATVSGGPYTTVGSSLTASYMDTGLSNGTTYYYVVSAVNGSGEGGNSAEVGAKPAPPPAAPTGLTAAPGKSGATLKWTTTPGATAYNVKRSIVSGGPYIVVGHSPTAAYTDTGLTNGTTYYYVVSASNSSGEGPNSSEVNVYPNGLYTLHVSPSTIAGGLTAKATVTLIATAIADTVVALGDTNSAASEPSSVTVVSGTKSATYDIHTSVVSTSVAGSVKASLYGASKSANLTVRPISVKSVVLIPSSLVGGLSSSGTVTLELPAAPGNIIVNLSSDYASAQIQDGAGHIITSITIPAGQQTGSFTVKTGSVIASVTAKVTATANGLSKSANLTIKP